MSKVDQLSQEVNAALSSYQNGNHRKAHRQLFSIYKTVKFSLDLIPEFSSVPNLGKAFAAFSLLHSGDDVDFVQRFSAFGYLILSLAIESTEKPEDLYKDRFILLDNTQDSFEWTIRSAVPSRHDDEIMSNVVDGVS